MARKRYNELVEQGAHPFRLSAWAQSRATESVLRLGAATDNVLINHPDVPYVTARLRERFPNRTFTVRTGPETDIAIAAARLIAREHYLNWLSKASFNLKVRLSPGPRRRSSSSRDRCALRKGEARWSWLRRVSPDPIHDRLLLWTERFAFAELIADRLQELAFPGGLRLEAYQFGRD